MYPGMVKGLLSYAEQLSAMQKEAPAPLQETGEKAVSDLVYHISHEIFELEYLQENPERKFQEAAFGIMLENHFGIVSTQTRKDFLASSWKEIQEINPEQSLFTVLNQTYKLCRKKYRRCKRHWKYIWKVRKKRLLLLAIDLQNRRRENQGLAMKS